jgi:putative ABC transport system ATP-binding protein
MLVCLKDVCRDYWLGSGRIAALKNVSFEADRAEFIAVMGPSGSGKSTLLCVLGCLHRPTGGGYFLEGSNVATLGDRQLAWVRNRKIGFVFQSFNLFPRLTAQRNVEVPLIYGGCPKGERDHRAREVLEGVGLADRMLHKPPQLSGGQQQKVAIARALVNRPSILLADEPTGNLDSVSGNEIMRLFSHLNRQGVTVIVVTHHDKIAYYAKRIITLKDGEIASDVSSNPG